MNSPETMTIPTNSNNTMSDAAIAAQLQREFDSAPVASAVQADKDTRRPDQPYTQATMVTMPPPTPAPQVSNGYPGSGAQVQVRCCASRSELAEETGLG